jgi:hypothetical protein
MQRFSEGNYFRGLARNEIQTWILVFARMTMQKARA